MLNPKKMSNFLTVNLPNKVTVKALGNRDVEIEKIQVFEMVDNPYKKSVIAICNNHPTRITLWEGNAYDTIGQWTDTDVINRILELYSTPTA